MELIQLLFGFSPLKRDGRIHLIPSAILLTPSGHIIRFRTLSVFNQSSLFHPPLASFKSYLVVPAFSCYLLEDLEQLSKHYHHLFSAHVLLLFNSAFLSTTFRSHAALITALSILLEIAFSYLAPYFASM